MALTINLDQVKDPEKTVIFRTYGDSEKLASGLAEKFLEVGWKKIGTVLVADNKALVLEMPKDYKHNL